MFGLKQVIVSSNSSDIYNPKVIRSTMGSLFRLNIIESTNLEEDLKELKKHKYKIYATSLDAQKSIYDVSYQKVGIVVGNEANGISKPIMDLSDEKIKIPMIRTSGELKCVCCNRSSAV